MTCDVCKRNQPTQVVSSCLWSDVVPISFAFCDECLSKNAEPQMMLGFLQEEYGKNGVAQHVRETTTWVNGGYVTWEQFCDMRPNT